MAKYKRNRGRTVKYTLKGKTIIFFQKLAIKLIYPLRRIVSIIAFKTITKTKIWSPSYYDTNIKLLYAEVREKEAITLITKIIDTRKGGKHLKMLIIESPDSTIEIALREKDYPQIYNTSKKAKK